MKIQTHRSIGNAANESIDWFEWKSEHMPTNSEKKGIIASDMDDTMFHGDSGMLIFIEYLRSPSFYQIMNARDLKETVIPNKEVYSGQSTRDLIENGANELNTLKKADCHRILELEEYLIDTYLLIQDSLNNQHNRVEEIEKFIQAALELDRLLIELNKQVPDQLVSSRMATIFSRVRLYKGLHGNRLSSIATDLLKKRCGSVEGMNRMMIHVNKAILNLLEDIKQQDRAGVVITGSPQQIASSLIKSSPYQTLFKESDIHGVQLQRCSLGKMTGEIEGEHVFGIKKRQILEMMQKKYEKKVVAAFGDHPSSDRHMGALALSNGGVFVITSPADQIQDRHTQFQQSMAEIMGEKAVRNAGERIVYVEEK